MPPLLPPASPLPQPPSWAARALGAAGLPAPGSEVGDTTETLTYDLIRCAPSRLHALPAPQNLAQNHAAEFSCLYARLKVLARLISRFFSRKCHEVSTHVVADDELQATALSLSLTSCSTTGSSCLAQHIDASF